MSSQLASIAHPPGSVQRKSRCTPKFGDGHGEGSGFGSNLSRQLNRPSPIENHGRGCAQVKQSIRALRGSIRIWTRNKLVSDGDGFTSQPCEGVEEMAPLADTGLRVEEIYNMARCMPRGRESFRRQPSLSYSIR